MRSDIFHEKVQYIRLWAGCHVAWLLTAARGGIFQPWNTPNLAQCFFSSPPPQGPLSRPPALHAGAVHHWLLLAGTVHHGLMMAGAVHHGLLLDGVVDHDLLLAGVIRHEQLLAEVVLQH